MANTHKRRKGLTEEGRKTLTKKEGQAVDCALGIMAVEQAQHECCCCVGPDLEEWEVHHVMKQVSIVASRWGVFTAEVSHTALSQVADLWTDGGKSVPAGISADVTGEGLTDALRKERVMLAAANCLVDRLNQDGVKGPPKRGERKRGEGKE